MGVCIEMPKLEASDGIYSVQFPYGVWNLVMLLCGEFLDVKSSKFLLWVEFSRLKLYTYIYIYIYTHTYTYMLHLYFYICF